MFPPPLPKALSLLLVLVILFLGHHSARAAGHESLWIEAEHLQGLEGYCWPMGRPNMKQTDGHWGVSGPGWASEWIQGGESNFMSVACGADDDQARLTRELEIPVAGTWHIWVRYRDNREMTERFQVQIQQPDRPAWQATWGERALIDEDNEMKLYWNWAFAWDQRTADLAAGPATLSLLSAFKEPECRQIDCIVLTTDPNYRPLIKDRPASHHWSLLEHYKQGGLAELAPLARHAQPVQARESWRPRTFNDKGFLYLWNVDSQLKWASDDPDRVLYPYQIRDPDVLAAFEQTYGGKTDVPIFSDPRIVPTFHGVGPKLLQVDHEKPALAQASQRFVRWLDTHPDRPWAMMLNYHPDEVLTPGAVKLFDQYRDRFVGYVAGESTGYYQVDAAALEALTAHTTSRRQIIDAVTAVNLEANAAKYRKVMSRDVEDAYREVIAAPSISLTQLAPLTYLWGARTMAYESFAGTASLLGMRMAFLRGAARQHGRLTATYRSCNFGDSATIFSKASSYTSPANILDNYYSVFSGAGMTWYKFDIWYQYMQGTSMFYHEQGFDEFWMPGGTTAAGTHPLQLSPKGKLVDRFLRITAAHPQRGTTLTPVAFLLDYAHSWEPSQYWPGEIFHQPLPREKTPADTDHHRMIQEYLFTAFYPYGPRSEEPITGVNETYVPSVFGDIFDVTYAYPDVSKWTTIDTYPVVIIAGDIELTDAEGRRLAAYVQSGGTLLVTDAQLAGPGATHLQLPRLAAEVREADGYLWRDADAIQPAQRFRYRPIVEPGMILARTPDGHALCSAWDRGQGRLIYLSIPHGLGIDRQATPIVAQLMAHLTRGLMPVEVVGDVQWFVNQTDQGYLVTLLNPAGQAKPQQGITPTDYRENRTVTIRTRQPIKTASDRLLTTDTFAVEKDGPWTTIQVEVLAGSVRVMELK